MSHYDINCAKCGELTFSAASGKDYNCKCDRKENGVSCPLYGVECSCGGKQDGWHAKHCILRSHEFEDDVKGEYAPSPRVLDPYHAVSNTLLQRLENLAVQDAKFLNERDKTYGDSWRKRGGSQAFAVFARKWDRIENIVEKLDYDVFKAWELDSGGIVDDLQDLRRYLLLLEEYCTRVPPPQSDREAD